MLNRKNKLKIVLWIKHYMPQRNWILLVSVTVLTEYFVYIFLRHPINNSAEKCLTNGKLALIYAVSD